MLATNRPPRKTIQGAPQSSITPCVLSLSQTDGPRWILSPWPRYETLRVVETMAVPSDSSKNPNRHVMMCTSKGSPDKRIFKMALRTGDLHARLWLSTADNRADTIDRLSFFGGSTSRWMSRRIRIITSGVLNVDNGELIG